MALSPSDLKLTRSESLVVERLEKVIDALLQVESLENGIVILYEPKIFTAIANDLKYRIKNELIRRYKDVGWKKVELDTKTRFLFSTRA